MLEAAIKNQLKDYFKKLEKPVTLSLAPGTKSPNDEARNVNNASKAVELKEMLTDLASLSDKLLLEENVPENGNEQSVKSPLFFRILSAGEQTGITFRGIPGGHEFSSLILAILQAGGADLKLDQGIQNYVRGIKERLEFRTYVSLSCHNCPDVVQALNSLCLLNENITHEMVDGALFPEEIQEKNIQGVPSVYLNDEAFANGKIDAGEIMNKLMTLFKSTPSRENGGASENFQPAQKYDLVIVGGGPGGVSAAIYGARKGLKTAIVADRLGGQVKDTMAIENLISVKATNGPELAGNLAEHLQAYEIDVKEHLRVEKILDQPEGRGRLLELNSGETLQARSIVIATGAKWRELGVPGEKEYLGKGVAYCPHCDGPFFKDKDVAVIGGGNSGVEAALDLSGIVKSVKLIEFGALLRADQVLLNKLEATPNIETILMARTQEIRSEADRVNALLYEDRVSGDSRWIELDGVFVQIGLIPNSDFLGDLVERNEQGEILTDEKGRTSVPGIFACGDVTNTPYKQIVIAIGEGAKAGLAAFEYLTLEESAPAAKESEVILVS